MLFLESVAATAAESKRADGCSPIMLDSLSHLLPDRINRALTILTIGHSTRPLEELVSLLHENDVEALTDVRRYPASRRHPQFNRDALELSLPESSIEYVWMQELGGRRTPRKDSHNTVWRNAGFRGYADYMETEPFQLAVAQLLERARVKRTAIMCAEQAWQQCHRGLISDFVKARGIEVIHILGHGRTEPHPWTAAAHIVDGKLSYAAAAEPGQEEFGF
jgi:uncharacterized protein (DUF488 family)